MRRREFLGVAGGLLAARSARAAEGHIEVFIEEPIATISPGAMGDAGPPAALATTGAMASARARSVPAMRISGSTIHSW